MRDTLACVNIVRTSLESIVLKQLKKPTDLRNVREIELTKRYKINKRTPIELKWSQFAHIEIEYKRLQIVIVQDTKPLKGLYMKRHYTVANRGTNAI